MLRLMVDQWSRKVFALGNCYCWQPRPDVMLSAEERGSPFVQSPCPEEED